MGRLGHALGNWCKEFGAEWMARREGVRRLPREIQTAARHIIGPTGFQWSDAWKRLEEDGPAYLRSFDPKIPPSVFRSPSDLTKSNHPVPLAERCIEDWNRESGTTAYAGEGVLPRQRGGTG